MTDDLSTKCDCIGVDDSASDAHQMVCSLWDNDLFAKGIADWNPGLGELVLVHPMTSLHTAVDDVIGGLMGDVPEDAPPEEIEPDPEAEAWLEFESRCQDLEDEIWLQFDSDIIKWPLPNYTIDGVSRVFNPECWEWDNKPLKCHCEPPKKTFCDNCGVVREADSGTYWQTMWRASLIRVTDIACRCPLKSSSQWNCLKCDVKRIPVRFGSGDTPAASPMMKWTSDMAKWKSKKKGGVTAWNQQNWNTGGMGQATTYVACRHKGRELEFPNGKKIYGSSCHAKAPEGYVPDFGVYLDSCWYSEQTCLGIALPWQDMGLPRLHRDHVEAAVDLACKMIERGDIIEVGCIGGHGRTGTFLAMVALRNGVETPEAAIEYVREHYCEQAIESATQEWYVKAWFAEDNGLPIPEKPVIKTFSKGTVNNYNAQYKANKDKSIEKSCDGGLAWYCKLCNADQDDDAEECYWCEAQFTNPGVRPADEWYETKAVDKLAEIASRVKKPQKAKATKRTPPKLTPPKALKAVKDADITTDPELPFSQNEWFGAI